MAGKIQGITIEIAGKTSGLVSSLKDADKALSATQAALRQVNKALELDPSNIELAAQKEALLTQAVEETGKRLEALKQAADMAAKGLEDGTVSKDQYAQLAAEIAITEKNLQQLEGAANGSADEMEDLGKSTKEAGEDAEESSEKFVGFGDAVKAAAGVAAAAVGAMAAAFTAATKALVDFTVDGAAFADGVITTSAVTGIATDKLQEYMYAAELIDVSVETLTGSMKKNLASMSAAAEGSGKAAEAYELLGISVTDANGNLRNQEDVYWEVIDALGNISNETERDALAMDILGKSAQDLNPLIEAGAERMAELGEEAHEAGYVLGDSALESFGAFDDELQRLSARTTAAKNALGTVLLPVLTSLAGEGSNLLGDFTNAVLDAEGDVEKIGEVIDVMIPEVIGLLEEFLPLLLDMAVSIISSVAEGLLNNIDPIIEAATEIIVSLMDGLVDALPQLIPAVVQCIMTIAGALVDHLDEIIEAALQLIIALGKGLTEHASELVPAVADVILDLVDYFLDHLPEFITLALDLMVELAAGLVEAIPEIVARIPEIIASIIEAFGDLGTQLWDKAPEWGLDLIDGFVSGIKNGWNTLVSTLEDFGATVASYIGFSEPEKGPLSIHGAHPFRYYGPDMVDLWTEGVENNLGQVANTMTNFGNTIANGVDYSGQLANISAGIGQINASGGQTIIIPVNIGGEEIDTIVVDAGNRSAYLSGGVNT